MAEEILDQIAKYREATITYSFGGFPHQWVEFDGGKMVELLTGHPDILSFPDDYYYNVIENVLYAKEVWWWPVAVPIVEYDMPGGQEPNQYNITSLRSVKLATGRKIMAFVRQPDPKEYGDNYYYDIPRRLVMHRRSQWTRHDTLHTMRDSSRYVAGRNVNLSVPSMHYFRVYGTSSITLFYPFTISLQAMRFTDNTKYASYKPQDIVSVLVDANDCEVEPRSINNENWLDGAKTFQLTIKSNKLISFTTIVFLDHNANIIGSKRFVVQPPLLWDKNIPWDDIYRWIEDPAREAWDSIMTWDAVSRWVETALSEVWDGGLAYDDLYYWLE